MKKFIIQPISLLVLFLLVQTTTAQVKPIALNPQNPHYFTYKGKPTVLITSGEHYGSVMNPDFNYMKYLKSLQKDGLNLTRTMTGAYFEPAGAFNISNNTLGPVAGKYLCPWMRTGNGLKFDLSQWNPAYFVRLKDFMGEAQKRGVIVELSLFCPFYGDEQWVLSPFNSINNVNGLGNISRNDVYTLDKNKGLLDIQEKMVRKLVNELKAYPNLMYEICNEPYFGGITLEWQQYISKVITDAEKSFPYKHLITQNIGNGSQKIENPNPLVSVFNFHYAAPPTAVTINYDLNKVIGENETGFNGQKDSTYRKEAWELMMAGGGLFNNLDYSFTPGHEVGTYQYPAAQPGGGSPAFRKQLSHLKKLMDSFNFVAMKPDNSIYAGGLSKGLAPYILAEGGKQYAFYLMGGQQVNPELNLPKGDYSLQWLNPLSGMMVKKEKLSHAGGKVTLASPVYEEDIALKIIRK